MRTLALCNKWKTSVLIINQILKLMFPLWSHQCFACQQPFPFRSIPMTSSGAVLFRTPWTPYKTSAYHSDSCLPALQLSHSLCVVPFIFAMDSFLFCSYLLIYSSTALCCAGLLTLLCIRLLTAFLRFNFIRQEAHTDLKKFKAMYLEKQARMGEFHLWQRKSGYQGLSANRLIDSRFMRQVKLMSITIVAQEILQNCK